MTEPEWAACTDPFRLFAFLLDSGRLSDRKVRLFAVACCRRVMDLMPDSRCRAAVAAAERFADGLADVAELAAANAAAHDSYTSLGPSPYREATEAAYWASILGAAGLEREEAPEVLMHAAALAAGHEPAGPNGEFIYREERTRQEERVQCRLLRDLAPYRRVRVEPRWLTWNHGTVPTVARRIDEERTFHDLPILADALEDAGCASDDLLNHCRSGGEHVRGCWAVDLLLGNE